MKAIILLLLVSLFLSCCKDTSEFKSAVLMDYYTITEPKPIFPTYWDAAAALYDHLSSTQAILTGYPVASKNFEVGDSIWRIKSNIPIIDGFYLIEHDTPLAKIYHIVKGVIVEKTDGYH